MTVQTKLPPILSVKPETRSEPQSPVPTNETKPAESTVYWGDRLTVKFWLFCFGLMVALQLINALRGLVLSLMGQTIGP